MDKGISRGIGLGSGIVTNINIGKKISIGEGA